MFRAGSVLETLAERSWAIAPAITTFSQPAFYLADQLKRVTGMAYTDDPERDMSGGIATLQPETRMFLLKDAVLIDGSLYIAHCRIDFHARSRISRLDRYVPRTRVESELYRASMYSSYDGHEFFGLWLTDDCPNYLLARDHGVPVTTSQPASEHMLQYERRFGMKPMRTNSAYMRELVLFDDHWGNNLDKHARFSLLRQKLLSQLDVPRHPGTFILRRDSGKRRTMYNEIEMAEYLRERRGFRIVDVTRDDIATIAANCAGASVIAGIEGSHMVHGLMAAEPGAAVLTLQPPDRFCSVIKRTTDMEGLRFGFVVGRQEVGGFSVDPAEVERTLDLFPRSRTELQRQVSAVVSAPQGELASAGER